MVWSTGHHFGVVTIERSPRWSGPRDEEDGTDEGEDEGNTQEHEVNGMWGHTTHTKK